MLTPVVLLAISPLLAVVLVWAMRNPVDILLPAYAVLVPFGSGLSVPGLSGPFGSPSSVLGLLLIFSLGYRFLAGSGRLLEAPPALGVWLLFLAYAGLSVVWSVDSGLTVAGCLVFAGLLALYFVVRVQPVTAAQLSRTASALVLGGVLASLYGLGQAVTGTLPTSDTGVARLGGDLIDPNHTAAALILPLVLALTRLMQAGHPRRRAVAGAAVAVMLAADVITGSRSGILGAAAAIGVVALTSRHRARIVVGLSVVIAVLVGVFALTPLNPPGRLSSESTSGRIDIWRVGLEACTQYCATGSGWNTFGIVYAETLPRVLEARVSPRGTNFQPHNILLLLLIETGLPGLTLGAAGIGFILLEAWRLPAQLRGPPLGAFVGLLVTGMFIGNLEFKYWWMVPVYIGLVHTVAAGVPKDEQASPPGWAAPPDHNGGSPSRQPAFRPSAGPLRSARSSSG